MAVPKRRTSRSRTRSRRARWLAGAEAPHLVEVRAPDGRRITVPRHLAPAARRGLIE